MNSINSLQVKRPVVKRPHDAINLARSKGEYAPKWTRNVKGIMAKQSPEAKQNDRSLEDVMLFA